MLQQASPFQFGHGVAGIWWGITNDDVIILYEDCSQPFAFDSVDMAC